MIEMAEMNGSECVTRKEPNLAEAVNSSYGDMKLPENNETDSHRDCTRDGGNRADDGTEKVKTGVVCESDSDNVTEDCVGIELPETLSMPEEYRLSVSVS
jgi:hypothetical protein